MGELRFSKLQGMGNDFLVVEVDRVTAIPGAGDTAIAMCNRNYGAGADGLIFVAPGTGASDFESRIFNSDGSEAGVSGNGTRCVAAHVYFRGLWDAPNVRIGTSAGTKLGTLVSRQNERFEFEFDMGTPRLRSSEVPMALDIPLPRVIGYPLHIGGDMIEVTCLSMGNPQCLVFVADLERVNLSELGPLLEHHPVFPDRANVEFVRVLSPDEIEIRIWERGAGHTLSSGTGSCAAAVASILNGFTNPKVQVNTEGGALSVEWSQSWSNEAGVKLTGAAEMVYEGHWLRAE